LARNSSSRARWTPLEALLGEHHPSVASYRANLAAAVLHGLGNLGRARDLFERAIESERKTFGEDHPRLVTSRSNLAALLRDIGDLSGAKDLLESAISSTETNFGHADHRVATLRSNLAAVLVDLGDLPRAKELLEQAIDAAQKKLGDEHPNVITYRENLAEVVKRMNAAAAVAGGANGVEGADDDRDP
jgi:tetratricopeptide (TPR) repeat protein